MPRRTCLPSCAAVSGMLWWSIILFPAYAGVIPDFNIGFFFCLTFPRIRGGDPLSTMVPKAVESFSPHTRG